MHIVLNGTVLKKDGTIFLFLILGMMEKVLGGTMGVLKHDVTMVTGMIDKLKGRALPERNISDDGGYQRRLGAKHMPHYSISVTSLCQSYGRQIFLTYFLELVSLLGGDFQ